MATSRVLPAVLGSVGGYLIWLGLVSTIPAVVPVHMWPAGYLVILAALVISSGYLAHQTSTPARAIAARWAPLGPVLATLYLGALFING